MRTANEFLSEVERFLAESGMRATVFGKSAIGDPNLVRDLRNGRAPSLRLVERITDFMDSHKAEARP